MFAYHMSKRRAEESLSILTEDQKKVIKELYYHGGKS